MNKIDYGFYEVNLFEGEMNSDWFLKINPKACFSHSFTYILLVPLKLGSIRLRLKAIYRDRYQQWLSIIR